MPYDELIRDVRLLVGGSLARKTPDYYTSLAKQYAEKAMNYASEAETYATESENVSKEVTIMRDVCRKYFEQTQQIADSIKDMQINIITDEDIDTIMENNNG